MFVTSLEVSRLASLTRSHISVRILRLDGNCACSKHFVVWKVIRFDTLLVQGLSPAILCIGATNHLFDFCGVFPVGLAYAFT